MTVKLNWRSSCRLLPPNTRQRCFRRRHVLRQKTKKREDRKLTVLPRVPRAPFSPGSPGCPTSPREPISPTTPEGPLSPWTQTADHRDVNRLQQSLRWKSTFLCSLTAGSVQVNCPERETSPSGKQLKGQIGSSQEIMRGTCHCSCWEQWQVENHYVLSRSAGMWCSAPVFCLWEQDLGCRRCFLPSCPAALCSLVALVFPLAPETTQYDRTVTLEKSHHIHIYLQYCRWVKL